MTSYADGFLPEDNLMITDVRDTLGSASDDVAELCKHFKINPWSRYKPIRCRGISGSGELFWPEGVNDIYNQWGLKLRPEGIAHYAFPKPENQGWGYDKPTGGEASPYRLGDFRGYYHKAISPFRINWPEKIYWKAGTSISADFITANQGGLVPEDFVKDTYGILRIGLAVYKVNTATGAYDTNAYCCTTPDAWNKSSIILFFGGGRRQDPFNENWRPDHDGYNALRLVPFMTIYEDGHSGSSRDSGRIGTFDSDGALTALTFWSSIESSGQGVGFVQWPTLEYKDYLNKDIDYDTVDFNEYWVIKSASPNSLQNETPGGDVKSIVLTVTIENRAPYPSASYPGSITCSITSFHGYQSYTSFQHKGGGNYTANIGYALYYKEQNGSVIGVPLSDADLDSTGGGRSAIIRANSINGSASVSLIPSYINK